MVLAVPPGLAVLAGLALPLGLALAADPTDVVLSNVAVPPLEHPVSTTRAMKARKGDHHRSKAAAFGRTSGVAESRSMSGMVTHFRASPVPQDTPDGRARRRPGTSGSVRSAEANRAR